MSDNKYVPVAKVYSMLTRRYKNLKVSKSDVVEMCGDFMRYKLGLTDSLFLIKDYKLTIDNRQALTPCNIIRLLDVHYEGNRINYYDNGTYIRIYDSTMVSDADQLDSDDDTTSGLRINYYGMPVDKDARPLIFRGTEEAAFYYCLKRLVEEDFSFLGTMSATQFQYIETKEGDELAAAQGSIRNLSRNEIHNMFQILYNWVPNVKYYPKYNLD